MTEFIAPTPAGGTPALLPQTASAVFMVRPGAFGSNPETQASNRFQRAAAEVAGDACGLARAEFDGLVERLREAGVAVHVAADRLEPPCPDAVFPNNWFSTHADGTLVLYPMLAPSRRHERRLDLLRGCLDAGGYRVRRLLDLAPHELQGRCLEGTGSVVFDHVARVAYACLSPRTHPAPLAELCAELGYTACVFAAVDAGGVPIYHTNVMLALGSSVAVVASAAIVPADRERVLASLAASGRECVEIDAHQMGRYAGNVLELRAADGARVLAMSAAAAEAYGPAGLERLGAHVDRIVAAPVPTLEALGGGSVRCTLAELYLPR
jgi:hypothetical protein